LKKLIRPILSVLLLVVSCGLLAYAWLVFQLERANQALQTGNPTRASEIYLKTEAAFLRIPPASQMLQEEYRRVVFGQVAILYADGENDGIIEKLEEASAQAPFLRETAEYSFWMGNVLVRRALSSKQTDDLVSGLKVALAEYQKGLVAEPDDWDLKYNYELVKHVLSRKEQEMKNEGEKLKSIIEKIRPPTDKSQEQIPVEKRG
jgi:hypothetical protein